MEAQNVQHTSASDEPDEGIDGAISLLRRDIDELTERAEALDLDGVVVLLDRAARLCSSQVPDPEEI